MCFEHKSIACLSLEFLYDFKKSNLNLIYLRRYDGHIWMFNVNNVLINLVKFSKCLDFETFLRKSCSLNSESKSQAQVQ